MLRRLKALEENKIGEEQINQAVDQVFKELTMNREASRWSYSKKGHEPYIYNIFDNKMKELVKAQSEWYHDEYINKEAFLDGIVARIKEKQL